MNTIRSIAVQGVGFPRKVLAVQGFWQESSTGLDEVSFAPYLWALQPRLYTLAEYLPYLTVDTLRLVALAQLEGDRYSLALPFRFVIASVPTANAIAMTDFFIKKGDTLPRIESTLKYSTGASVDLTGATQVQFIYKPLKGGDVVIKVGTILNAAQGKVAYNWLPADTTTPGDYQAEWQITFTGGGILTIPNNGTFIEFRIVPSLD